MKTMSENYCCIKIEALALKLRIGLLPEEKQAAQRVLIDLDLYGPADYLQNADPSSIIDYAVICDEIRTLENGPHIALVEDLAADLLKIAFAHQGVTAVRVKILKPDIIPQAGGVGIELFSRRNA